MIITIKESNFVSTIGQTLVYLYNSTPDIEETLASQLEVCCKDVLQRIENPEPLTKQEKRDYKRLFRLTGIAVSLYKGSPLMGISTVLEKLDDLLWDLGERDTIKSIGAHDRKEFVSIKEAKLLIGS